MLWDDLRYFIAVARAGTLSKAARELGISHATVIRRIDQLETDTQTRLFRRLQNGYRLTEDAFAFHSRKIPSSICTRCTSNLSRSIQTSRWKWMQRQY